MREKRAAKLGANATTGKYFTKLRKVVLYFHICHRNTRVGKTWLRTDKGKTMEDSRRRSRTIKKHKF